MAYCLAAYLGQHLDSWMGNLWAAMLGRARAELLVAEMGHRLVDCLACCWAEQSVQSEVV